MWQGFLWLVRLNGRFVWDLTVGKIFTAANLFAVFLRNLKRNPSCCCLRDSFYAGAEALIIRRFDVAVLPHQRMNVGMVVAAYMDFLSLVAALSEVDRISWKIVPSFHGIRKAPLVTKDELLRMSSDPSLQAQVRIPAHSYFHLRLHRLRCIPATLLDVCAR